jgi:hypothetical protein
MSKEEREHLIEWFSLITGDSTKAFEKKSDEELLRFEETLNNRMRE